MGNSRKAITLDGNSNFLFSILSLAPLLQPLIFFFNGEGTKCDVVDVVGSVFSLHPQTQSIGGPARYADVQS